MTRPSEVSAEKLYQAVDRKRRAERISWRRVAAECGMPDGSGSNVMTRLGRGHLPSPYNFVLLLLWVGQTDVRVFLKDRDV